jgi:hypothetical protein
MIQILESGFPFVPIDLNQIASQGNINVLFFDLETTKILKSERLEIERKR